jgi:hypothetical protein
MAVNETSGAQSHVCLINLWFDVSILYIFAVIYMLLICTSHEGSKKNYTGELSCLIISSFAYFGLYYLLLTFTEHFFDDVLVGT